MGRGKPRKEGCQRICSLLILMSRKTRDPSQNTRGPQYSGKVPCSSPTASFSHLDLPPHRISCFRLIDYFLLCFFVFLFYCLIFDFALLFLALSFIFLLPCSPVSTYSPSVSACLSPSPTLLISFPLLFILP